VGDHKSEGSWRSLHLREVYEQKLHTSGILWAMLQNKQKPGYCTEHYNVNAEANYLCEDMPEAESKTQEELSLH